MSKFRIFSQDASPTTHARLMFESSKTSLEAAVAETITMGGWAQEVMSEDNWVATFTDNAVLFVFDEDGKLVHVWSRPGLLTTADFAEIKQPDLQQIGWQIMDEKGSLAQTSDDYHYTVRATEPSGLRPNDVLNDKCLEEVQSWLDAKPGYILKAVFEDDIENPVIINDIAPLGEEYSLSPGF